MYGMTQSSAVSIDWSSHIRSMLRRSNAACTPIRFTNSRRGPAPPSAGSPSSSR